MGFGESVSTCFKKYAVFSGRARRSELWWFVLFYVIVQIIANILDALFGTTLVTNTANDTTYVFTTGWISTICGLALLLPFLSVEVRRLHDTGRSGWWWWLTAICCIGQIILLVWYLGDSAPDNQYGPNPKGSTPGPLPPATV